MNGRTYLLILIGVIGGSACSHLRSAIPSPRVIIERISPENQGNDMSRDAAKILALHLMTVALMVGCMLNVGGEDRQIYLVVEGTLLWPVFGTLKDLFIQIKRDLLFA